MLESVSTPAVQYYGLLRLVSLIDSVGEQCIVQ